MKVLTDNKYYGQIADVIREQNGTNNTYKPAQMVRALKDLFYEEVEGVPPISFNGIGENLLDYRIDGASGGVGERTKNLLKNTANSFTLKGVTFTVNNDKSITCNGTASSIILIVFSNYFEDLIVNNEYIFSGCPPTGSISTYRLQLVLYSGAVYNIFGEEKKFTYKEEYVGNPNKSIRIVIEKDCVCNNITFYPMMRLASIEDDTYEPYGYKVPVVVSGKNLFNKNDVIEGSLNPYDGKTIIYNDQLHTKNYIPVTANDVYIISGLDYGIRLHEYNSNHNFIKSYVVNNNNSFTVSNNCAYIRVAGSINQFLDTGMINLGSTSLPYEPYHEPIITNIYLDEPIGANESISLSDTNTNIPTIRGTNILTVDTTVQPSNVYVKSRHESSYEAAMRERYEEAQAQLDALESE